LVVHRIVFEVSIDAVGMAVAAGETIPAEAVELGHMSGTGMRVIERRENALATDHFWVRKRPPPASPLPAVKGNADSRIALRRHPEKMPASSAICPGLVPDFGRIDHRFWTAQRPAAVGGIERCRRRLRNFTVPLT
jgi:hypothetical protein